MSGNDLLLDNDRQFICDDYLLSYPERSRGNLTLLVDSFNLTERKFVSPEYRIQVRSAEL